MENNRFTPAEIAKSDKCFRIPLYQRLFEWSKDEITQLLNDLNDEYEKMVANSETERPYYIGMLTAHIREGVYDLVDGQQRFTVLTLISIALGWDDFYLVKKDGNVNLRLTFFAREQDLEFIKAQCGLSYNLEKENGKEYENKKMKDGIECVRNYFAAIGDNEKREKLKEYIKNNTTFFISFIPEEYSLAELNKYFEAMNSAGRALENYEILKVELLRDLDADKEKYTRLWNLVSNMDVPLIRLIKDGQKNEPYDHIRERYRKAIAESKENLLSFFEKDMKERILNEVYKFDENDCKEQFKCIKDIAQSNKQPKPREQNFSEVGLFSFPLFLLLVLYQTLPKVSEPNGDNNRDVQVAEFFKVGNLLETFKKCKDKIDVRKFLNNLVHYRLILDYYFIHLHENAYRIDFFGASSDTDEEQSSRSPKAKLVQFQSMLYVSSVPVTYYRWLCYAFDFIDEHLSIGSDVDVDEFLRFLKDRDNNIEKHSLPTVDSLNYKEIDRYWFWRLDYYLWENAEKEFPEQSDRDVVNAYVFKRNRSIEHIAPQTPQGGSKFTWNNDNISDLHRFGNLAMISSGQNSLLLNKPYEEKQGHVKAFVNGSMSGSVESLKMLKIYKEASWDVETIKKHEEDMMRVLTESYEI